MFAVYTFIPFARPVWPVVEIVAKWVDNGADRTNAFSLLGFYVFFVPVSAFLAARCSVTVTGQDGIQLPELDKSVCD